MSKQDDGGSAFPQIETDAAVDRDMNQEYGRTYSFGGMSLRDYFAAKAMQSLVISSSINTEEESIAQWAYRQADAMLKEREK